MNDLPTTEIRMGELARHDYWLEVTCHDCRHQSTLDPSPIAKLVGSRKPLAKCRFRCSSCDSYSTIVRVQLGHIIRKRSDPLQGKS